MYKNGMYHTQKKRSTDDEGYSARAVQYDAASLGAASGSFCRFFQGTNVPIVYDTTSIAGDCSTFCASIHCVCKVLAKE